jgi:hypothetical protein
LDKVVDVLGMDKDQHRYLERTRLNCKENVVVRAVFHGQTKLEDGEEQKEAQMIMAFGEDIVNENVNVILDITFPKGFSRIRSMNIDTDDNDDNEDLIWIVNSERFGDSYLIN